MTWVRIDEGFPEHPKVIAAGPIASWLHVCALAYCNRQLTDGVITTAVLARLSDGRRNTAHAAALVEAGLWEVIDGGWLIHDFLHYQPSRAKVESERAAARERMANNRRSSQDVRANNDRSSEDVRSTRLRSVSDPSSKSVSVSTVSDETAPTDDDQIAFDLAIKILVEHKAREHPPTNRRAWEKTTVPQTVEEDGDTVRAAIANGRTAMEAAGDVLGSQRKAVLAAERLK